MALLKGVIEGAKYNLQTINSKKAGALHSKGQAGEARIREEHAVSGGSSSGAF